MSHEYSATWFATFLAPGSAAPVHRELAFVRKHLPAERYPRVLDVPCGIGRHAGPLDSMGYEVLGIDCSTEALDVARKANPGPTYRVLDMRDLRKLEAAFDAVLCLWQSFGFGDAEENRWVLEAMADRLRPGGRLLLDVYNAEALGALPAESVEPRAGRTVRTRRTLAAGRFRVHISYSDRTDTDTHDWMVYTPSELVRLAGAVRLAPVLACAWFDDAIPPSAEHQRMQLLFERMRE